MLDVLGRLAALDRPRLLVSAARFAVDGYRRDAHLTRLIGVAPRRPGDALMRLMDAEAEIDARRRAEAADYSPARHIDVLTAMLGEARLLRASRHALT